MENIEKNKKDLGDGVEVAVVKGVEIGGLYEII